MNYRAQGKRLDNDIRELITTTISDETFSKRWGSGLFLIVKQLFKDRTYEIMRLRDEEEKRTQAEKLSKSIAMFCAAFL